MARYNDVLNLNSQNHSMRNLLELYRNQSSMRSLSRLAGLTLVTLAVCSCSCFNFCPFDDEECSPCCGGSTDGQYSDYPIPQAPPDDLPQPLLSIHSDEILNIVQGVSVDFKHDRHLNLQDARTYYNDDGIHTIQLKFITQNISDVCDARMLIIDLTEALMSKLNSNPFLLPEFTNFGFYPYNFEIYITFESFYVRYVDPYYIKWICMEDGQIAYYAGDLDDNNKDCWHVRRESFYTSRDIVFYQRKAEAEYKKAHLSPLTVFGNQRYIPPDEDKNY